MGVIPVNEKDKGFNFDGESSKTFDLIITGGAIFGAPERDVELIEIPGRNGAYVQDLGRFKNVTVTYKCALTSTKEHEFVDAMRKVREWLGSKKGYCRLWDDFNPGEYRMAMFKGHIDVTNEAPIVGRFDLSFECKPQRFLLDGDNPVAVSSGGKLYNPTLFDASPLLKTNGHGTITINGEQVVIHNEPIGRVELGGGGSYKNSLTYHFDESPFNAGDVITVPDYRRNYQFDMVKPYGSGQLIRFGPIYSESPWTEYIFENTEHQGILTVLTDISTFRVGTEETAEYTVKGAVEYDDRNGTRQTKRVTVTTAVYYDGAGTIRFTASVVSVDTTDVTVKSISGNAPNFYGTSTKNPIAGTAYIDLDIGEAYAIEDGAIVGINNIVDLPVALPVLKPGSNTIEYGNTFTGFDIIPRWWEV